MCAPLASGHLAALSRPQPGSNSSRSTRGSPGPRRRHPHPQPARAAEPRRDPAGIRAPAGATRPGTESPLRDDRAARAAEAGRRRARPQRWARPGSGGLRDPLRPRAPADHRGRRLPVRRHGHRLAGHRGRAAERDAGGVLQQRGDHPGRPALAGGHAQAGGHRLLPHDDRPVGRRLRHRRPQGSPTGPPADLRALPGGRQRLRAPGRGPDRPGRPRPHGGHRRPRPRRRPAAGEGRQLHAGADGRRRQPSRAHPPARRRPADRDHPARGAQLHRRRPRGQLAEVAAAGRLQPARGAGAAPDRLRGPRHVCAR